MSRVEILTKSYDRNLNNALELLDAGFTAKAHQKRAIDQLNRAYESIRDIFSFHTVHAQYTGEAGDYEAWSEFLQEKAAKWEIPFQLNHVRERHIEAVATLDQDAADKISEMVDLRTAIKAAPINKPEPKKESAEKKAEERVRMTLKELMEKRKTQYLRAVELGELFNGLPVTCNTHMVINQYGTVFFRTFYFLAGEFTPLSVIVAAAQELERRNEG